MPGSPVFTLGIHNNPLFVCNKCTPARVRVLGLKEKCGITRESEGEGKRELTT